MRTGFGKGGRDTADGSVFGEDCDGSENGAADKTCAGGEPLGPDGSVDGGVLQVLEAPAPDGPLEDENAAAVVTLELAISFALALQAADPVDVPKEFIVQASTAAADGGLALTADAAERLLRVGGGGSGGSDNN